MSSLNEKLTMANPAVWYQVPQTVQNNPTYLEVGIEQVNGSDPIRFGFASSSTPSTTYGNRAPQKLKMFLASGDKIYYSPGTANDIINYTITSI